MCQSRTGRLTGLWFLPKPAFGLNTNNDDDPILYMFHLAEPVAVYIEDTRVPDCHFLQLVVHSDDGLVIPEVFTCRIW